MRYLTLLACLVGLTACTADNNASPQKPAPGAATAGTPPSPAAETPAGAAESPVEALRRFSTSFSAQPEHNDPQVTVQHLLVAFAGSGVPGVTRTKLQAEELAAEIWKRIQDGGDFDALVKKFTNDSYPGKYTLVAQGTPSAGSYLRSRMAPAFGNAGWRLAVGEFGLAAFDAQQSPFGWHIVKRIE